MRFRSTSGRDERRANPVILERPRSSRFRRRVLLVAGLTVAILVGFGVAGTRFYAHARFDPLQKVDAIVVLGGAHDGRESYGIDLARRGYASQVVLSDPYRSSDERMREFCATRMPGVRVRCFVPDPATTRGEAEGIRELAVSNGWERVMVISWRYHLPRARFIFGRCADTDIVVRPVPRDYDYSVLRWAREYLYQTAAFAKAATVDRCR